MNTTIIIAFACVLGASVILAIPFAIWQKKRKGNEADFNEKHKGEAILNIYAKDVFIDDADVAYLNPIRGQNMQKIVALSPGTHNFEGIFETTNSNLSGKTVNITSKKLRFNLTLEAGYIYSIDVYLYSPEQRANYYKGDVGKDVFTLELDIESASLGVGTKAYVICYQEAPNA